MRRRTFINKAATSAAFVGLGGLSTNACAAKGRKHLTVLHTNDVHSHIDAFPIDHREYPNMGGLAQRANLVNSIRQENPNTLLFDAGDIFQGTPYFNFYGGELEFKLMSMLHYDAATIGNHDFDKGIEGLLAQMPYAKFELLSANYDFGNTLMDGHVKPYKVYWVDGLKIGVYGLGIALDGLVLPKLFKETKYLDPYEIATDCEYELKVRQACDLVICLSHMGYYYSDEQRPDDLGLASRTKNTQLIIGGHTHTFLEKPTIVANGNGDDILVNQVGCYGIYLGRIDLYFEDGGSIATEGTRILIS